ncbi:PPE domain-containing protein [Mycobacterium sp.]|uniref:PPE domain-containing protein n=1 Tax=Mycobacterium sp. TaxID=1785 RepID=UPI003D6B7E0A
MGLHPWPMIDPATSYLTMTSGAGAAPMHAYSAAMTTLGASGEDTVVTSALNTVTTAAGWSGVGHVQAAASVSALNTMVTDASAKALLKAQLAQAAGELHTMTVPRMVTHVQATANRTHEAADEAINPWVLGALTPEIVALNLEYFGFMWPNNAQAGLGYGVGLDTIGGALAALSALPALAGGSAAAPAMAAAQVGETAAISGLSAVMSTAEQAATAAISPATATTTSGPTNNMLGDTPLAAPATPSSSIPPMAAVHAYASATPSAPSLAHAQTPVMGMFAPPPSAAVTPPAPSPALPVTAPPAPVTPPMPAAAPGVTSYVPPAQPFSPPPPTAGRAAGLKPGMLNAAALRGPVSTAPLTTSLATATTVTATQSLAYVPPEPPLPPSPPQPPLLNLGDAAHTLKPPSPHTEPTNPPAQLLTPPTPPHPPAPPSSPPAPSTDAGGSGVQMLGTGPGGAPQAPPAPLPLDPEPTPPPPPPVRGRAPDGIHPPVEGPLTPGPPSKAREQRKGAEHLWDDQGGEWRYHPEDSSHNPHWDYKPPGKSTEWEHRPVGDLPPLKGVDPSLIATLPPWMQNLLAPGVPGGPQNPLLAPYPGATIPAPPPASPPAPGPGLMPHIDVPPLNPGDLEIAGGETAIGGSILIALIIGILVLA